MAAETLEQVLALGEHRMDIHPGNGPAGAHRCIAATAQHHRGPVVSFANAPRRQPYNAAVPAFSHHHNGLVPGKIHLPADCFQRLLGYLLLQGLARAVVFLQMRGDTLRLLVIRSREQPDTLGRVLQPAAGIEARRQAKTHMAGIHRRSYAADQHQRAQSGPLRPCHGFQAQLDNDAVLVHQGHDIGHCGQGGQFQAFLYAFHALERLADLQRHPGATQPPEGIIPQQRIEHCIRGRRRIRQLMVVADDHRHAQHLGQAHLLMVGNPAVHGNQQTVLPGNCPHRVTVKAIAFPMAAGNIRIHQRAFLP